MYSKSQAEVSGLQTNAALRLRINLTRLNVFSLRISTEATLTEELSDLIGLDPKRKLVRFYEEYTRSGTLHSISLRFVQRVKQERQYGIRLVYETEETQQISPISRIVSQKPKPSEVFLILCRIEDSLLFHCDCSFLYRREDKKANFLLPVKVEDELFDEIRGVRFVKLGQDKILWENSVDLVETDVMVHRVRFTHEGKCSADLPQKLVKQAKAISRRT
jgi:hypothetical protein